MCRFIETIRVEQGEIRYIEEHQQRMDRTLRANGIAARYDLSVLLSRTKLPTQRTRCRVEYGAFDTSVDWIPYQVQSIQRLEIVEKQDMNYHWKYANRSVFQELLSKTSADEVIVSQRGWLTDATIGNVALWDGKRWCTPSRVLLEGTHRERLLRQGRITVCDIHMNDLEDYEKICIFNAMLDFEEIVIPITQVF